VFAMFASTAIMCRNECCMAVSFRPESVHTRLGCTSLQADLMVCLCIDIQSAPIITRAWHWC
jgi:hypothetical protein